MSVHRQLKIFKLSQLSLFGMYIALKNIKETKSNNSQKDLIMKKWRVNFKHRRDINGALNRYITSKTFESRIMEHPREALERTSLRKDSIIFTNKKKP